MAGRNLFAETPTSRNLFAEPQPTPQAQPPAPDTPAPAPAPQVQQPSAIPQPARPEPALPNPEFTAAKIDADEILGIDPNIVTRGDILPFGRNAQGEMEFAVPGLALDLARSILLPGQALQGVPVTGSEAIEFATNIIGGGAAGRLAKKTTSRAGKLTAEQIAKAPTSIDLAKESGKKFTASRQSGAALSPDDYVGFLAGAERDMFEAGVDATLHPKLTAVFNALSKKVGGALDAKDLHNVRRTIGIATESLEPDEARIARILRDNFDDFVENLDGTDAWKEARKIYIQSRKAETIEEAINKAGNAASGLENGLRIELRKILNDKRKRRGFSKIETAAIQAVVDGDFTTNSLRKIGQLGFGRGAQRTPFMGTIGGGAGAAGGSAVGGPLGAAVGAVVVPAVGAVAARGAEKNTLKAVKTLQALIGGVRPEPVVIKGRGAAIPAAGAAGTTGLTPEEEGGI